MLDFGILIVSKVFRVFIFFKFCYFVNLMGISQRVNGEILTSEISAKRSETDENLDYNFKTAYIGSFSFQDGYH